MPKLKNQKKGIKSVLTKNGTKSVENKKRCKIEKTVQNRFQKIGTKRYKNKKYKLKPKLNVIR